MNEERAVGPGSVEEQGITPTPLLEGATEFEYVEVLNPLSVPFVGQFGVTRSVSVPFPNEDDIRRNYGVELRNPQHSGRAHIINKVEIPSGKTVRLLGNEAQVVVRQLVTAIMQREGKNNQLADAFQRRQVEQRIVISRGTVADILGRSPQSVSSQLQEAIKEEEFPEVNNENAGGKVSGELSSESDQSPDGTHVFVGGNTARTSRKRGRPAKAKAAPSSN